MRRRFFASFFVVVALIFGVTNSASADQWDYIYGEDPTNAENLSAFTNVRIDPTGGLWVIGYFFGSFEGLQSQTSFKRFAQHRNVNGGTDFTIELSNFGSILTQPPSPLTYLEVDGNGTLYTFTGLHGSDEDSRGLLSITNSGRINRADSSCQGPIRNGGLVASPEGGIYRLCYTVPMNQISKLQRVNEEFVPIWEIDIANYHETNTSDDYISLGPDNSIWFTGGFNKSNSSLDLSTLPLSLRPALSLGRFRGSDGSKIVSIKHYGDFPGDAPITIGTRQLWQPLNGPPNSSVGVFDAATGAKIGLVASSVLPAEISPLTFESSGLTFAEYNGLRSVFQYPFGWAKNGRQLFSAPMSLDRCTENLCAANIAVRNDGRRLVVTSGKQILVYEIDGIENPTIGKLLSSARTSGEIVDADVDSQGNIVVVGATFQTTIKTASTRTVQASVNERAFISRNPMGRISLDVLPRTPLRIKVAGTNGVPSTGVGAVSMNVTVTSPDGEGFITVYPCDTKPDASNLNYTLDQTVPNAVIAPVSSTGDVCFYTNAQTHLLADINGYFPTGQGFTAAGPARVFDTRSGSAQGLRTVNKVKIGGDQEVRVQMSGISGITPSSGVGAVSLNITATGTTADEFGGYVTVYPCGDRPNASSLNFVSGQTVPNAVIAPVSASGEVCFYARGTTDLIVDINGYFLTGAGFTPTTPARIADTRSGSDQGVRTVTKTKVGGDITLKVKFTDIAGLTPSSGVGAVSLNVTATGTTADEFGGYVTVYPCGALPNASNLNFVSGQTVPNAVIAPVSASGEVCFYARGTTDLIVDLNGYFLTGAGFAPMSPVRLFDTR